LAAEGVDLSIYFWIDTDENNPMAIFDRVATGIKSALGKTGVELYPTNPVVVPSEGHSPEEDKREDL
jgi:hypothetical protein